MKDFCVVSGERLQPVWVANDEFPGVAGNRSRGIQHLELQTETLWHLRGAGRASLSSSRLEIIPEGTDTTLGTQVAKV